MSFNPGALENNQRRAMEESKEPVVKHLHEQSERARQKTAGVPNIADRRKFATETVGDMQTMDRQSDAEQIAGQLETLRRTDLTEADFFTNPALSANNTIPGKRLERMREVLATYTIKPSQFGGTSYGSAQEARAALVEAWNKLVQVSTAPGKATPQSMTQRSNYAEATANALREVVRLQQEEALQPKVVPKPQSSWQKFGSTLKRVAGL